MNQEMDPGRDYFRRIGERYAAERARAEHMAPGENWRDAARRIVAEERRTPEWDRQVELFRAESVEQREQRLFAEMDAENYQLETEPRQGSLELEGQPDEQTHEYLAAYQFLDMTRDIKKRLKLKQSGWVTHAAAYLLDNPQAVETCTKVWLHPIVEVDKNPGEQLYNAVKEKLVEVAERNWETMTPERLQNWITLYAHTDMTDIPESMLAAYFKGPHVSYMEKRRRVGKQVPEHQDQQFREALLYDRAKTYYNLAYATVSVASDPQALLKAEQIGQFVSPVLNFETHPEYCRDVLLITFTEIDDDVLLQRAYHPAFIFNELMEYSGLDRQEIINHYEGFIRSSYFQTAMQKEKDRRVAMGGDAFGRLQREARLLRLLETFSKFSVNQNPEMMKQYEDWPGSLFRDVSDPLRRHYVTRVRERALGARMEQALRQELGITGQTTLITLASDPEITLTVGLPIEYQTQEDRLAILQQVAQDRLSEEQRTGLINAYSESNVQIPYQDGSITYKGTPIVFWYRRAVSVETSKHNLSDLESVGFPQPALEKNKSLQVTNDELQRDIRRTRRRFLTPRGIKIFLPTELQRVGYEHIVMKQDRRDPHITHAELFVAGRPYTFLLTRDLSLNLEGKDMPNSYLQGAIHWLVLSYLKQQLCREFIEGEKEEKEEKGETKKIVERAGHYRSMPPGYTFSFRAAENCWRQKREILSDECERLRRERVASGKDSREFTYVSEITSRKDLDPVVVHFNSALQFAAA